MVYVGQYTGLSLTTKRPILYRVLTANGLNQEIMLRTCLSNLGVYMLHYSSQKRRLTWTQCEIYLAKMRHRKRYLQKTSLLIHKTEVKVEGVTSRIWIKRNYMWYSISWKKLHYETYLLWPTPKYSAFKGAVSRQSSSFCFICQLLALNRYGI